LSYKTGPEVIEKLFGKRWGGKMMAQVVVDRDQKV